MDAVALQVMLGGQWSKNAGSYALALGAVPSKRIPDLVNTLTDPHGFSAPAIRHADIDSGFLITEDFGSAAVIEGDPPRPIVERYEAATDMLAELHRKPLPETVQLAPQLTYDIPAYDIDAWLVEMGLMLDWYLPDRGAEVSQERRDEFVTMWRTLLPTVYHRPDTSTS